MMTSAIAQAVYETNKHRRNESQKDIYSSICKSLMTFCAAAATTLGNIDNIKPPKNFDEAMQSDDWENWCYVTAKELTGMQKMEVFSREEYTIEDLRRIQDLEQI